MSARVTLGGVPCLASAGAGWALRPGVASPQRTFDLQPSDAENLLRGGPQPIALEFSGDAPYLKIGGLYAIHESPADVPDISRVVVVDLRFWWSYQSITRRYNVRRRVGNRRLADPGTPELQPVVDAVWYAPWSTKEGKPWTARQILEDVLKEAMRAVPGGDSGAVDIAPEITDGQPIENLELDETADQAIARVLAYLPRAEITITPAGRVRVYLRGDGSEETTVDGLGPESVGGGHVEFVRMANVRPRAVHVLFTREIETRFDFRELASTSSTQALGDDERYMQNVLPVPDWTLALPSGATVAQGTWVSIEEALLAWGAAPVFGAINFADLRRLFSPFMDAWAPLQLAGDSDPDQDWSARLAALQQHWRRTYRINRRWMDRILSLRPWRVATIDPVTGTRGPAVAYGDYCYLATMRSMIADAQGKRDLSYAMNVQGWPAGGRLTSDAKPAPARVTILDHDQGIIHLDYLADPVRMFQSPLPGQIELEGDNTAPGVRPANPGPTADPTNKRRPIAFGAIADGMAAPLLTGQHAVAVILSAVPASPNDDRQFTRLVRRADSPEVRELLPGAAAAGLADARGPILEVRVGAGLETARVAWNDDLAPLIEAAFGVNGEPSGVDLNSLTINKSADAGGGSLDEIATAVAARVYAGFCDRHEGSKTAQMNPGARVGGNVAEILHEVSRDGAWETRATMSGTVPSLNLFSLLPDSTRRFVLRLADPGRV